MQMQVSLDQLEEFAEDFWNFVNDYRTFAWHGDMGAGKTTLIMALAKKKGVRDALSSPTFSIINQYLFNENGVERMMYHIDLYRLKDEEEVVQAGVEDAVFSNEICMVEWPGKAPHLFDENTVHVFIEAEANPEINSEGVLKRSLRIELPNNRNL
jgi:tRNA threonylcarbamoyladenosine biosynthesis protein TsaE